MLLLKFHKYFLNMAEFFKVDIFETSIKFKVILKIEYYFVKFIIILLFSF